MEDGTKPLIVLSKFYQTTKIKIAEKFILNQNIAKRPLVLNAFGRNPPLALLFATEQKYTCGAAMKSAIQPQLLE
jgi:hypothetical protein